MKRSSTGFKALLAVIMCIVLSVPRIHVDASTQKQMAMRAYKIWLGRSTVCVLKRGSKYKRSITYSTSKAGDVKFALAYIDNDGIPELIISTNVGDTPLYGILTYKNGRISRVYNSDGRFMFSGYYNRTGCFLEKYNFHDYIGGRRCDTYNNYYIKMGSSTFNTLLIAHRFKRNYSNPYKLVNDEYTIVSKSRVTNRSEFIRYMSNVTKGKSLSKVTFYRNTSANRNKILK